MSEETQTPETQEPQISLADFSAALQVIDVCTTRGAFRGEELSSVGQLRDRLKAFVEFHAPAESEESEAEEGQAEEAPAEVVGE
jgi:hypothetical protein